MPDAPLGVDSRHFQRLRRRRDEGRGTDDEHGPEPRREGHGLQEVPVQGITPIANRRNLGCCTARLTNLGRLIASSRELQDDVREHSCASNKSNLIPTVERRQLELQVVAGDCVPKLHACVGMNDL